MFTSSKRIIILLMTVLLWAITFLNANAFVIRPSASLTTTSSNTARTKAYKNNRITMDTEGQENYHMFQSKVQKKLKLFYQPHQPQQKISLSIPPRKNNNQHEHIDNVIRKHGMPWTESIDPTLKITTDDDDIESSNLLYMPFWIHQLNYMKHHLTNLKLLPCTDFHNEYDFTFHENTEKKARIHNLHFTSDEYRKIRMTYYDNGHKVQVFNSLWYPSNYNNNSTPLPVLGIDLLQFNKKKHLVVIDFQPIIVNDDDNDSDNNYENILKSIRDKYPTLQGQMSNRFYDETQFFSKQMLFSRFDSTSSTTNENDDNDNDDNNDNDNNVITNELMPAFQQYISTHVDMVKKQSSNMKENKEVTRQRRKKNKTSHKQQNHQLLEQQYEYVLQRQEAYDIYSAHRDPATKMFENMFGKEWADKFVHEFLFSLSRKSSSLT